MAGTQQHGRYGGDTAAAAARDKDPRQGKHPLRVEERGQAAEVEKIEERGKAREASFSEHKKEDVVERR